MPMLLFYERQTHLKLELHITQESIQEESISNVNHNCSLIEGLGG